MITKVGPAGEILESNELRGRFHNAIGALVRDKLNPAISNWKEVNGDGDPDLPSGDGNYCCGGE